MIARTSLSRATNQWLRTANRAPACTRSMASAAGVNPFHFEVSDANGIKIASRDDGAPTTSLALVVRAGSRYQPAPGLAHGLQQFAWKNTEQRSALRIVREIELLGGTYGSTLSHENIVLKGQFLRQDLPYFIESIGQILTSTRYQQFIFSEETTITMKAEVEKYETNPSLVALERALGVAFHKGIGHARFSMANKYVNVATIENYAKQVYNKSNIALVASGAPHAELSKWTKELMGSVPSGSKATSPETKYYGGETRVDSAKGNAFIIAFPGTASSPNFKAEYKVLAHLLGGETAVKWNSGFSLLSRAVADLPGVSAVARSVQFTDTGLLYITVTGPDGSLEQAGKAVVKAIHDVTTIGQEDIKKAVAQAKFDVLAEVEDRSVGLELVGQSLISNGTAPQAEEIVKAIDGVSAQTVQKIAKSLLDGRATFSAVGDLHVLPYAEDIGLKI